MENIKDIHQEAVDSAQNVPSNAVKVSALWYFVEWYLAMLENTGAVMDEEFARYFKQLMNYVNGKIKLPQANRILAEYVVYEIE